jgi:hypothetical protein
MDSKANTPVGLRRGAGVALAIQWNAPLLLLFWYPWEVVHLLIVANCFLWALGALLAGRFPRLRCVLFPPQHEGVLPRWNLLAIWMAVLGMGVLAAWFFEQK